MQIYPQKLSPAMVPDRASPAGLLPIATVIVMLKQITMTLKMLTAMLMGICLLLMLLEKIV